jgi:hypothetical protein
MWLVFLCLMSRVVLGLHVVACGGLMGRVVIVILRFPDLEEAQYRAGQRQ